MKNNLIKKYFIHFQNVFKMVIKNNIYSCQTTIEGGAKNIT
jgi:hypothetical protein